MWGRLLVGIVILFGVWYYFNQKKAPPPPGYGSTAETGAAPTDCFLHADRANAGLTAAAAVAGRPPVDQGEWARVESETRTAISAAESACLSSGDALQALGLMRTSLSELAAAARGEGGATGLAARQGEIDNLLNRARGR